MWKQNARGVSCLLSGAMLLMLLSTGALGADVSASDAPRLVIDGRRVNICTMETVEGTTTLVVDSEALSEKLGDIEVGATVHAPVPGLGEFAAVTMTLSNVEEMAKKKIVLEVSHNGVSCTLDTADLPRYRLLSELGAGSADEVSFTVSITRLEMEKLLGHRVIVAPVKVAVTVEYNGKKAGIDSPYDRLTCSVSLTEEQAQRVSTAVALERNGRVRHIPTNLCREDKTWYAKFPCADDDTYALVESESSLTDVEGTWYAGAASELSERLVLSRIFETQLEGDRAATRAEFASVLVSALGLPRTFSQTFQDVSHTDWYGEFVPAAAAHGIVDRQGVGDDTFSPQSAVTRQEAMTMLHRAARLVGYAGESGDLRDFGDTADVAPWAWSAVTFSVANGLVEGSDGMLRPRDTITRAESVAVVLRLLQQAGLVDVRTAADQ